MGERPRNLNQAILQALETYSRRACFQVKREGLYRDVSFRRFRDHVLRLAKFFRCQGINGGERIAIVANNSTEWMAIYVAGLLTGGVILPVRSSATPAMLRLVLQDSGASIVAIDDVLHLQAIEDAGDALPDLKVILALDTIENPDPRIVSLKDALTQASPLLPQDVDVIRSQAEALDPQATASIFYTAGEKGMPKGAVFDQTQLMTTLRNMRDWLTLGEDTLAITFIDWSQAPSLLVALYYLLEGVTNVLAEGPDAAIEAMQQTSPTLTLTSPYFFEQFYDVIMDEVSRMPESSRDVFHWAVAKGREFRAAGLGVSDELREEYTRADMTFFSRIRGRVGGRMRRFYSAGASLPQALAEFFEAVGFSVLNVYSLTEAGGFPAVSRPEAQRYGSVGRVAPGFQICLAEDDEILVRGDTVTREYWRRPEETRRAIDDEGRLHSGDLGRFDRDGYLYITGRKRHVMVLSTGRKVVPGVIESALTASPFIVQAAIFGEGKAYISALVVPDLKALKAHFQTEAPEDGERVLSTSHPKVKALFDQVIAEVNAHLDSWERIVEYRVLDQCFDEEVEDLTRPQGEQFSGLAERYATQIEALYPLAAQIAGKQVTQVQIPPERLRQLLEKEAILDAWLEDAGIEFLLDLAREKQMDAPSMLHICDAAAAIAQMESEEKPLSTALIVGDPMQIAHVLPVSEVRLMRSDHIRRMRKTLISLARLVDGLVLAYVVDKHGYVRGIRKLEVSLEEPSNLLLGPQFRRHAAISQLCNAVVFFVPTGGQQVRVFADGQLVGRYANGDWLPESMARVDAAIVRLAEQGNYDPTLIRRLLRCAFQMSEQNLGGIFVVGNADMILTRSDPPETKLFATIASVDVARLSDQELINFARQDGATIIDAKGEFRGCMVLLRPAANTAAEIGPGKGARHSSAAKISAEAQCLAITVSQDGPISVYHSGRRVLSL